MQNTFQCVMVTDGAKTFVLYLYPENEIQWGAGAQIGLDSGFLGSPITSFAPTNFMHPAALTSDSIAVANTTNVGINGMWVFRTDTLLQLQAGGNYGNNILVNMNMYMIR